MTARYNKPDKTAFGQTLIAWHKGLAESCIQERLISSSLFGRFTAHYQQLVTLPRKRRRALQRQWKHTLAGIAVLMALGQTPATAAVINVNGGCTLVDAITAANTDTATGGCPGGSGADTINLPPNSTQTLTVVNNNGTYIPAPTGLPIIVSNITIEGNGSTIERSSAAPDFRIFTVGSSGNLTLRETTVSGGRTSGDNQNGGGIFVFRGNLTLSDSTLSENSTQGNSGGGGGLFNSFGSVAITNSTVSDNTASYSTGGIGNSFATMTITSSTISGNSCSRDTGGVGNSGVLTITDSTITGNTAGRGGGVFNTGFGARQGLLNIANSTISGNTATRVGLSGGGGIFNTQDGTMTVSNSDISGNTAADSGGGVNNTNNATLAIVNSTISGNTCSFRGGGVDNIYTATLTVVNSTISGNTSSFIYGAKGGGIFNGYAYPIVTLINSTISRNTTFREGGGIHNDGDGIGYLINSTISNNTATLGGGGVFNNGGFGNLTVTNSTITGNTTSSDGGGVLNGGNLTLSSTLISGNSAAVVPAEISTNTLLPSGGFNLIGHSGLTNAEAFTNFTPAATDIFATSDGTDPTALATILDTTLADNGGPTQTHALVPGSPAIDAVMDNSCPPPDTDQRGAIRPQDGDDDNSADCDIGAYEFQLQAMLNVNIDFKPGNQRNPINPHKQGGVWVAVLSDTQAPFDPTSQVDISSIQFGPDGAEVIRNKVKDINKDGVGDLLLRFKIPDSGIMCGDLEATLSGETFSGDTIQGSDFIQTRGCK